MNILDFLGRNNLTRCDKIMSYTVSHAYYNDSNNRNSQIDYFVTSHCNKLIRFEVIDNIVYLSDHLPLLAEFSCVFNDNVYNDKTSNCNNYRSTDHSNDVLHRRWDHADLSKYIMIPSYIGSPFLTC